MIIGSPVEQFQIHNIYVFTFQKLDFVFTSTSFIYLGWIDFSLTNSSLAMGLAILLFTLFSRFSLMYTELIGNATQSIMEMSYEFIYFLIEEQVGMEGFKYFNFLFTLFMFILCCNLLGMIPYNFTATSHIVITFGLSLSIFIGVTIIGFVHHGFHYFSLLVPSGVPAALLPLIVSIEFVSYLTRGLSLGIRLTANVFAGHSLLKIIATFGHQMLKAGGLLAIASLIPVALLFVLTGLEIVIAMLQAYIFTVLTCSYLNDAINLH